jgi:chorismate dehydratase
VTESVRPVSKGRRPALRVGCVPYLNAKPLIYQFSEVWPEASLILEVPRKLGHMMDEGEIDIAMVSSIHQMHRDYQSIPHIGIVSDGPVRSILLHSRVPLEELETVALLEDSMTSCALTKIILEEYYGRRPTYHYYHLPVEQGLFLGEAALTIGDPRYYFLHPEQYVFDLGEEWKKAVGLPFVYARWLATDHVDMEAVTPLFLEMKQRGCANLDRIIEQTPQSRKFNADFIREFLTQNVLFDVGPRELEGLEMFFNLVERVNKRAVQEARRPH